mmetsp:Transcript_37913/g.109337  ORF Transcript_37913/g.109337 Transcript_37913/m.109337 type:complete len:221 (-) Transcript_37913:1533-2195(-)
MPSLRARASNLSSEDCCVSSNPLMPSLARLLSRTLLIISMPTLMSCSSSCASSLFDSARAMVVGIVTTLKDVRSWSVNISWSLIMRNWNDRNWSGASPPPPSQPKRSRRRATRSTRRSRKSGKLRSRNACPVGAMSIIMWSNFSVSTSSSNSTSDTISSLPGGNVSKRFTKSSMGSCCRTCPTRPPSCWRNCSASRTVAWKRCMAAEVSTSIAQSSPGPM